MEEWATGRGDGTSGVVANLARKVVKPLGGSTVRKLTIKPFKGTLWVWLLFPILGTWVEGVEAEWVYPHGD